MKLVKPNKKYAASFWRGLKAMRAENKAAFSEFGKFNKANEYVRLASNHAKGKELPPGWIPYFTYWSIVNEKVVGQVQLRPTLTKHLREVGGQIGYSIFPSFRKRGYGTEQLALTLKKAKKLGLKKLNITCDDNNIGSKKIIESNGGVLTSKTKMGKGLPNKLVYWIQIK